VGITQTNCYIIASARGGEGIVIDPGAEAARILSAIESESLLVRYVINTHGHFDHIGANAEIVEATGAALAVHLADGPLLKLGGGAAFFGLPGRASPAPDLALDDGQVLVAGDLRLQVLHTPGHSPGGVTLYIEEQGVAFDGDVLFAGGVGRADLPGASWDTLLNSITDVLFALPDDTVLYPGHGPSTTIGREKRSNPWVR
jgi:glyoxylase-like metal-dependent hydrolase (beta-lactamase superfamily II)